MQRARSGCCGGSQQQLEWKWEGGEWLGQRDVSIEFVIDWMWRGVDFSLWRMNGRGCREQKQGTPRNSRWEVFFFLQPLKEQFWISQMAQKGLGRRLHL